MKKKNKVVYLGFHKTGTTSIGALFNRIGLNVIGPWNVKHWNSKESGKKALEIAKEYDAFQDNPWPLLYKQFDKKFPNSKFIFYERDVNDWYLSNLNFFRNKSTPMRKYIYGEKDGSPVGNEEVYKKVYLQHSSDVLHYFENRPDDFLQINNLSDESAQQIGKFLGYPSYAELTMLHKNKSKH